MSGSTVDATVADPFRLWEHQRAPAVWRSNGQVLVARGDLVRRVLADPITFGCDNALDAVTAMPWEVLRILAAQGFRLPATLANNATPTHPAIRAIVAAAMTPRRVDALRPWLSGLTRRRLITLTATLRAGRPVDVYPSIAADLPLLALAKLVDLPDTAVAEVKRFSRAALELFWGRPDHERQRSLASIVADHYGQLADFARTAGGMVARLREHCGEHRLGHEHVVGVLFFLLVAGQETTSQFLTHLMRRLIDEPAVVAELAEGTVSAEAVVEEGLRLEPPIVSWRRIATVDTTLAGIDIAAGESVLLWLGEAGRQAAAQDRHFIPAQRGSRRHLAFGAGAHRCTGAQLARMEAAVVVSELAPLLRHCRVLRSPQCPDNLSFRMPDALWIVRR